MGAFVLLQSYILPSTQYMFSPSMHPPERPPPSPVLACYWLLACGASKGWFEPIISAVRYKFSTMPADKKPRAYFVIVKEDFDLRLVWLYRRNSHLRNTEGVGLLRGSKRDTGGRTSDIV